VENDKQFGPCYIAHESYVFFSPWRREVMTDY